MHSMTYFFMANQTSSHQDSRDHNSRHNWSRNSGVTSVNYRAVIGKLAAAHPPVWLTAFVLIRHQTAVNPLLCLGRCTSSPRHNNNGTSYSSSLRIPYDPCNVPSMNGALLRILHVVYAYDIQLDCCWVANRSVPSCRRRNYILRKPVIEQEKMTLFPPPHSNHSQHKAYLHSQWPL